VSGAIEPPIFPDAAAGIPAGPPHVPGLEAGAARRRLSLWRPTNEHVNSLLRNAGDTVLARARWLVRNNGYARAALRAWASATVGAGIKPSPLLTDPDQKQSVAEAFSDWTDEADSEGLTDLYGITRRVSREAFLAGECFVRMIATKPERGLSVPLQLQLLPSEQLPLWRMVNAPNGNVVKMGIEFNADGGREAYWFWKRNPTDYSMAWQMALSMNVLERVPAADVLHIFDPVEAGQIRGLSGYAAAVVKLFMMDMYDDAELERKKQAARFATFVTKPPPDLTNPNAAFDADPLSDQLPSYYGPGAFMELREGEDVKFSEPADVGANYEAFQYRTLLYLSAATSVPYAEISADLSKATYASSRAGLLAFRAEVEAFQHTVLVFQFLRPIWRRWLPLAVLSGAVSITAAEFNAGKVKLSRFKAITPKAPWVDPYKDTQGEALQVQNGFKARSDVIEAMGYDAEETDQRIAQDHERERELGLDFTPSTKLAMAPKQQTEGDTAETEPADAEPDGDEPPGGQGTQEKQAA
jgi:lambda family phage portal protein